MAEQLGISRSTVHKWLRRYAEGGEAALADRSSRPIRMPQRTSTRVEQKVLPDDKDLRWIPAPSPGLVRRSRCARAASAH
ncbi:helix-turn-helix domain-containing protein [Mycolicibacterium agri]|nr:leucine zipper domain-containing protein [Mycolicibacterium agri]